MDKGKGWVFPVTMDEGKGWVYPVTIDEGEGMGLSCLNG
jgi:hypothetical protein